MIHVISGNVRKTRNPFGIPKFLLNRWHRRMALPPRGDAMLFTGLMYQFSPYIDMSTDWLARFEGSRWSDSLRFAGIAPAHLTGTGLWMMTPAGRKKESAGILQNIVRILSASGVDFFYQPALDEYSGVLLYDMGAQAAFVRHARFVAERLKRAGIRKLITVDPHTTYALKVLFPKYADAEFEVTPYFELIAAPQAQNGSRRVTLHDPCFYGRYLEVSDAPRRILSKMGVECVDVPDAGAFTACCGGPAESLSPKLSGDIARKRIAQLNSTGDPIVTMCPICLGNLRKSGARAEDLATLVASRLQAREKNRD
jgi:Fe-S oxidoreductase